MELTPVDCTLCQNIFGRYCVPKSSQHRAAAQEVLHGKGWEFDTIDFMRRHIIDRDIIHAGMFFGDFLPGLAQALAPGRLIYGFEPNPENFACAQWTAVLNTINNVRMYNVGLGEVRKQALMRMFENGKAIGGGSHIINSRDEPGPDEDVNPIDIVTIDEVVPATANIGIIQLDTEGYEQFALLGGLNTIRRCRPIILLETIPSTFVEAHLLPLGYKQNGTVCDNAIFLP